MKKLITIIMVIALVSFAGVVGAEEVYDEVLVSINGSAGLEFEITEDIVEIELIGTISVPGTMELFINSVVNTGGIPLYVSQTAISTGYPEFDAAWLAYLTTGAGIIITPPATSFGDPSIDGLPISLGGLVGPDPLGGPMLLRAEFPNMGNLETWGVDINATDVAAFPSLASYLGQGMLQATLHFLAIVE